MNMPATARSFRKTNGKRLYRRFYWGPKSQVLSVFMACEIMSIWNNGQNADGIIGCYLLDLVQVLTKGEVPEIMR